MFVGDSITHGFRTASYRWPLHKTLVDNGVAFTAVGVHAGNTFREGSVAPGVVYAGVVFNNRHSAMSSERAYEVSGRNNASSRLGHSNIRQWLGLDAAYSGPYRINMAQERPDVFVLMIGTNDTFSDYGRRGGFGLEHHSREVMQNLLGVQQADGTFLGGDMEAIVRSMREANPDCRILVLTLPTWHDSTPHSHARADYLALRRMNEGIARWAAQHQLQVVDSNNGMVDLTRNDKPCVGEASFFSSRDGLHPTPQGDLIIAETVARALGCPGRTAGLERRESVSFSYSAAGSEPALAPAEWAAVDARQGFTVALRASVGNGAQDGWERGPVLSLAFSKADAGVSGSFSVSESGIFWQGRDMLFSADMAANQDEIRVAWHPGNQEKSIPSGFYMWLGDRLIGEALPADAALPDGTENAVYAQITAAGVPVRIESLRGTAGCFAPPCAGQKLPE